MENRVSNNTLAHSYMSNWILIFSSSSFHWFFYVVQNKRGRCSMRGCCEWGYIIRMCEKWFARSVIDCNFMMSVFKWLIVEKYYIYVIGFTLFSAWYLCELHGFGKRKKIAQMSGECVGYDNSELSLLHIFVGMLMTGWSRWNWSIVTKIVNWIGNINYSRCYTIPHTNCERRWIHVLWLNSGRNIGNAEWNEYSQVPERG